VEWLGTASRLTKLSKGEVLVAAGHRPEQLSILLDGEFSVVLPGEPPAELARLHPGEVVGELTFLDPRPALVSVTATAPGLVLQVPHAAISVRIARDPAFSARFYRGLGVFLASRLREMTGRFGVQVAGTKFAQTELEADELDEESMERTALAARRFEFLRVKLGLA
jgi:CRP-like cAMP-binding protein